MANQAFEETLDLDMGDPDDALLRPSCECECERNLWFAVLEQAFRDATVVHRWQWSKSRATMDRDDAIKWFASDETGPGSLRWIVQITGLTTTVDAIRGRVRL